MATQIKSRAKSRQHAHNERTGKYKRQLIRTKHNKVTQAKARARWLAKRRSPEVLARLACKRPNSPSAKRAARKLAA